MVKYREDSAKRQSYYSEKGIGKFSILMLKLIGLYTPFGIWLD